MVSDKQHIQHLLDSFNTHTPPSVEPERIPATLKAYSAFDAERTAKQFYARFQQEHAIFQNAIGGLASPADRAHYASQILDHLMFLYFIQKKGFLDGNSNYLSNKLRTIQAASGKQTFLSFYRSLLLRLFQHPSKQPVSTFDALLGDIPYLNGELFAEQILERTHKNIQIPDAAFERLFSFFDSYRWQSADLQNEGEVNPDIIGYIFEKQINQKQMGAYYTRADITSYIGKNTLIPYLLQATAQKCGDAFRPDGFIWQVLRSHPERYISASVRSKAYLPTESTREYHERRRRYETLRSRLAAGEIRSVHDLITCNLDLCRYAEDVLRTCKSSALLHAFYESITTMSILDPTCGSGAFLFAALDILTPLYDACLTRMAMMVSTADENITIHSADVELFQDILAQVAKHPNRAYFILKTCILNNLYGVDIMGKAVEICKSRLFLKLIAQLPSATDAESLNTIAFNIRVGNALVGFAHYDDIKDILPNTLDFSAKISTNAHKALNVQLHRYLARKYGIDAHTLPNKRDYEKAFKAWCTTHRPFHWCIDFQSIMQHGGFAVIIGNPPYVEYSKVRHEYKVLGYEAASCGNLYAAVIERSLALCRVGESYLGLIVPLSLCGSERFGQLRRTITRQTTKLWLANFDIFPNRLFEGAFQRLSILLAQHGTSEEHVAHVTRIQRWYATERPHLINLITYTPAQQSVKADVFPKLAATLQESILHKLVTKTNGNTIATLLQPSKTQHFVYYQEATNYWMKATYCVPYYKKNGVVMEPPHGRFLYFESERVAQTIMVLMNSSLFYLWFATFSDGFHLAHTLAKEFPLRSDLPDAEELALLAARLQDDIKAHARIGTRNTKMDAAHQKKGLQIELEEYHMGASKKLLDEIDAVLARCYGLSHEELDFVLNYDRKYRMGKENEE